MEGHLYPAVLDFRDFLESAEILAIDLKSRPDTQKSRAFIPTEALKDYLSEGRLKRLLRYYNIPATHCEEIQERYLIVFTILFVIGKCAEINCFLHIERLNDDRLPFGKHDGQIWPKECSHFFHEFWNAQWKFCAHRLMRNALHAQRFEEERILPIIGRKIISEGPDSCTSKIEILPSYNFLTPPESDNSPVTNNTFVLKTFRRKDYDLYDNEVRAYKIIYSEDVFSHHTVKFYDSWIQNQEYSILMEYVEGGTLEEFFFSCPPPTDEEDIILFWERFVDLLKPLSRIHMHPDPDHRYKYLEGIHNDIKPTNILVTKPKSRSRYDVTFKLADMGLSHFAPAQKEGESRTKDTRGTQIFTAPEYYRDEKNTFLRRDILKAAPSKDIWSMGCVFSETVVWSVGGKEDLQKYGEDRVSATNQIPKLHNSAHAGCFHDGERVLDVVRETLVRAYRNRRQHDHIVPGMVTITEDMLETSPRRPNAVEVYSRCEKILSHAKTLSGPKSKNYQNETYPAIFQTSPMPPELPPDFDISALGFRYPDEFGSPRTSWDNRPPHRGTNLNGTTLNGAHRRDQHHDRYHTNAQASPPLNSKYPKEFSHHMSYHGSASSSESTLQRRPFSYPLPQPYGDQPSKGIVAPSNYQGSIIQGLPPLQPEFRPSITGMRPQTPESADLRRSEKPYDLPTVSIERVNEWISRRGMPGREKKSTSLLRMIEYLRTLDNRDQIFLFDNSASMQHHWPDVKSTFGALAYLVKSKDPDGIEIRFTSSPTTTARNRNRAPLLSKLNSIGLGGHCDIGLTLGKILRDLGPKGPKSLSSRLGLHKNEKYGVTIYVLTNGIWRDGDDWLDGIVKPIKNLVAQGTEKRQLGIQFIQFGQDPEGTKRLEILDDELRQHGVTEDFVDIEHWTGNVYKMLLGAIDPRWDRMRTQKSHNGTTSATHRRTSNSQYLDELPTFSTGTSSTRYNRSDKVGSSIPMPVLYETQATSFSEPLVSGLSPPTQDPTLFEDQVRQNTDMSSTGYSFSDKVGSSIPMPVIYETQATSFSEPLVSGLSPPTQDPTLFEDQVRQNTDTSSTGYSFSDKVGSSISMPVSYETQATSFSEPPILFEGQARQNTHGSKLSDPPLEDDNASSIMSDDSINNTPEQDSEIILNFANALHEEIFELKLFYNMPSTFFNALLEEKIKKFSKSVKKDSPRSTIEAKPKRRVAKAIYRLRLHISNELEKRIRKNIGTQESDDLKSHDSEAEENLERPFLGVDIPEETLEQKFQRYYLDGNENAQESLRQRYFHHDRRSESSDSLPDVRPDFWNLHKYFREHAAFDALVSDIQRLMRHFRVDTLQYIRHSLVQTEETALNSANYPHRNFEVHLHVDWDLSRFLKERQSRGLSDELGSVLTITGNSQEAQLETVARYIRQTWKAQSEALLPALQEVVSGQKAVTRSDDESSSIHITLDRGKVLASAAGSKDFLVAVAQQLAWLGATCRPSELQSPSSTRHPYYCDTIWEQDKSSSATFMISYDTVLVDEDEHSPSWVFLLDGLCIASGYRIGERSVYEVGLQLPTEFLEAEERGPEKLSFRDDNPVGSTTKCFIAGGPSYDLEKMLQGLEQPRTLVTLEKQLKNSLHNFVNPSFQETLMGLMERYRRPENKSDEFHSSGDLHRVIAELLDTNPSCIEWTDRNEISWCDIFKLKVEDWTKEKWNWWPFKPPQRALRPGEARLYWTCECGEKQWAEVPASFAKAVTRSARAYLSVYPASVQPPGAVHLKQSPSSTNAASSKVAQGSAMGAQAAGGSGSPPKISRPGTDPNTSTITASSPLSPQHVFLLVAAGSDFRLAQIRVERLTTYEFFRELRQQYNNLRPFLRRWLSIWIYSHCDFYRCDKYESHCYEPRREEFPEGKHPYDYQYDPNPMVPIPPIGPHQFYHRFHACYNPRPIFHFYHECKNFNKCSRDVLKSLPKCKSNLVEESDKPQPFWGIVAREQPSIFRLLLYNFVCALPCIMFFFMWLFSWQHDRDLQNASVPLSVMLGALSIFWAVYFANLEFKQGNTGLRR